MRKHRRKRRQSPLFYFLYALLVLALAVGTAALLHALDGALVLYEEGSPAGAAAELARLYAAADFQAIYPYESAEVRAYGDAEAYARYMLNVVGDREIVVSRLETGEEARREYRVMAGDRRIASFAIRVSGSDGMFADWTLAGVENLAIAETRYGVTAPQEAVVLVDDLPLGQRHVVKREIESEWSAHVPEEYRAQTLLTEYSYAAALAKPVLRVEDAAGEPLPVKETAPRTYATEAVYDDLDGQYGAQVEAFVKSYALFLSGQREKEWFLSCLWPATAPYAAIATYDDRFAPTLKSYRFLETRVGDYIRFADDCFACKARLSFAIEDAQGQTNDYAAEYRLVFQRREGEWRLYDMAVC